MSLMIVNELIRNAVKGTKFQDSYIAAVGGCVRDEVMRMSPQYKHLIGETKDYDYILHSNDINDVFLLGRLIAAYYGSTVYTFEKFGTAKLEILDYSIELAITRKECYYEHSRKPDVVVGTIDEDSFRRDFKMNAMLCHIKMRTFKPEYIWDARQGMVDLLVGRLSTCDEPERSFSEDPLRIMRAVRFQCKYNLTMTGETLAAIRVVVRDGRLSVVSMERYRDELMKILALDKASIAIEMLNYIGVLDHIMLEFSACFGITQNKYHQEDVGNHCVTVLGESCKITKDPLVRLAALLHDIGKPAARTEVDGKVQFLGHEDIGVGIPKTLMERLKFSNDDIKFVGTIIARHMDFGENPKDKVIRKTIWKAQETIYPLLDVMEADNLSHHPDHVKPNHIAPIRERIANMDINEIWTTQSPLTGEQIMELLGCKPGPIVGKIKDRLLEIRVKNGKMEHHDAVLTARTLYNNYLKENV